MLHINESFSDQGIRVSVGQVIELRLKENPSTGFQWSFAADGTPSCRIVSDRFERHQGPPGAGGVHEWQIKAVTAGTCHLRILYRRPFEPAAPPARSFTLDLQVAD
jgi:inhibitor of cysteine peptidase